MAESIGALAAVAKWISGGNGCDKCPAGFN